MSTKIYDVYVANKSTYEVFAQMVELHKRYADSSVEGSIEAWGDEKNDVAKIDVVIVPISNRRTAVRVFYGMLDKTRQADEIEQFIKDNFDDFHYQNSTDRPKEVSAQDWNGRHLIWEKLMGERGSKWSQLGMMYTIFQPQYITKRMYNNE